MINTKAVKKIFYIVLSAVIIAAGLKCLIEGVLHKSLLQSALSLILVLLYVMWMLHRRRRRIREQTRFDRERNNNACYPSTKEPVLSNSTRCMSDCNPDTDYTMCNIWNTKKEKDTAAVRLSEVQFSAITEKKAEKGEYFSIDIIMYEDEFRHIVDERLGAAVKETRSGYHRVGENAKIKVVLSSKDIEIDDCVEKRIWKGRYLEFGFVVEIPEAYAKKQVLFNACVYINDLIATRLKFFVDINTCGKQGTQINREDITSAFMSYSSYDRNKVALLVQGMKRVRPDMDIFFDVETLRSGQRWEDMLKLEIDRHQTLLLCWSKAASNSKWVDFEWRYALERKGEEYIEPIPIDPPEVCPPPEELNKKHFNDKLVYVIKALEYIDSESAYLQRSSTGERIRINKSGFTIGRLPEKADYPIDNVKVSKLHAQILCENEEYFIIDLNSANKTFTDGVQCPENTRVRLYDGCRIMLADEELVFKSPKEKRSGAQEYQKSFL